MLSFEVGVKGQGCQGWAGVFGGADVRVQEQGKAGRQPAKISNSKSPSLKSPEHECSVLPWASECVIIGHIIRHISMTTELSVWPQTLLNLKLHCVEAIRSASVKISKMSTRQLR